MHRVALVLFLALPMVAGEPLPIEDVHFFSESAWNRSDGVMQYNAFLHGTDGAHELAQEWGLGSARDQLSVTVPVYSSEATGLGDATVTYRRQLIGAEGSRIAVASRVSLVLPTRHAAFGERSSGLQLNIPVSAMVTPRLVVHASGGATWFRERNERELNFAQGIAFAATDRLSLALDASWNRCLDGDDVVVVRPGIQYAFDGPAGLRLAPGIALPMGTDDRQVLLYLAVERQIGE